MSKNAFASVLAVSLFLSVFLASPPSPAQIHHGTGSAIQQGNHTVHNLNTDKSYSTIQEAISDPETLDGHEISVGSGTYHEHVTVNKSLSLIGEDPSTTIIDGDGMGWVVHVTADNVEVRNFTIQGGTIGLWLRNSQNSKIIGNTLQHGAYGIRLYHSRNTQVIENTIREYTWFGFEIESSGNNTLKGNNMVGNRYNLGVEGFSPSDFINDIDVSNTVNGKPVHYLINQHNITIDPSTFEEIGYLGLVNSSNVEVKDLSVRDNVQGIFMASAADSSISGVDARDNWNGIYVTHSSNISVIGNDANSNYDYGIKFFNSSSSTARDNNVDNNGWAGIGVFQSTNSTVERNEASFNTYDLHLVYTNNSVVRGNNARIQHGTTLRYSIAVYYSHNNQIYHNNFDNRLLYTATQNGKEFTPRNSWDNGLEGNYWSDYGGDDADYDGVGETFYVVGEDNADNHPLMGKYSEFIVALEEKKHYVSIISNSTISQLQLSPDDAIMSFIATDENETMAFSRLAIPNSLLQQLPNGNLTFQINAEQPLRKRKWADEANTYFYFLHVSEPFEPAIDPWLLFAVAALSLFALAVAFLVLRRRGWRRFKRGLEHSSRRIDQQGFI